MTGDGRLMLVVDTNVWVDNYCADHVNSAAAKAFLVAARTARAELLYPVHAIKDVHYVLDHEFRRMARSGLGEISPEAAATAHQAAWACVANMQRLATPVGADASDVWLAEKYRTICDDYEDDFVLAACQRVRADYLVTGDRQLLAHADVCAKTPQEMQAILELRTLR